MIYIDVTTDNEWVLNINNNVKNPFPASNPPANVTYTFTHILSAHLSSYVFTINPPAGDPSVDLGFGATNARYTEFYWVQSEAASTLVYDGEYDITIKNEDNVVLYRGLLSVNGNSALEENPFVEYQSDNESNNSFIYIAE